MAINVIRWPVNKHSGRADVRLSLLHHTAGGLQSALSVLSSPYTDVSVQFVYGKNGDVYYMVEMGMAAWHAGVSRWGDLVGLNRWSIGHEVVNLGDHKDPYTPEQIRSLDAIHLQWLKPPYGYLPCARHRDVSPGKIDPSDNFPWQLYSGGIAGIEARQALPPEEIIMQDTEIIHMIQSRAVHPHGREVWHLMNDGIMQRTWVVIGYPHYAPGATGQDGKPQPDHLPAFVYLTDLTGKVLWEANKGQPFQLGKDRTPDGRKMFYRVVEIPQAQRFDRIQVDYGQLGLGDPPHVRTIITMPK